ncbi:uncharacterized protein CTRU02_204018 [Colletotrichum truncatum]|uniref:Uncharacterized protein n=1 Tax=Colletotrichum truncatum TaxID=5467 RepID=A0ACC3ZAW1_COLTU|nr:uncharacterized protein CTRU02_13611 [Colletotrichum truncatum]KAF6783144.1 hypothetical protein CTRU02_13611 [Colletotrichum truncatum]
MDDIPYEERVEWPPLAAFKKAGDGSSSNGSDRLLPQPRRNKSDDQMGLSQGDGMYEAGRSQTYRQNGIKEDYLGIVQSYLLAEVDEQDIVSEINMGKLPDSIRDVVNELDIVEKKEVEREGK